MLDRVNGALDSVKQINMLDVMAVAGAAAVGITFVNQSAQFGSWLLSAKKKKKLNLEAIAAARQSALSQLTDVEAATNGDSLESALVDINAAIADLQRTFVDNADALELSNNKKLLAKLFYARAHIYVMLQKAKLAEADLLETLKLNPSNILAHNLLAHIYLYPLDDKDKARQSLDTSLAYNKHQAYAMFYHAMLNDDFDGMGIAIEKLLVAYHLQFESAPNSEQPQHPQLMQLLKTTPFVTMPYMLVNWLDVNIARNATAPSLLSIINAFNAMLNHENTIRNAPLRTMMEECRLNGLLATAHQLRHNDEFDEHPRMLRDHCSVTCGEGADTQYFFECAPEYIDKSVTGLFANGTDTSYLKDPKYAPKLADIMIGWAKQGLFAENNDPLIEKLCQFLIAALAKPNDTDLAKQLMAHAQSIELIECFVEKYVTNSGWEPWLTVVSNNDEPVSLLQIACEAQQVNLVIYTRDAKERTKILSLNHHDNSPAPTLRVIYDPTPTANTSFRLLSELNKPSDVYLMMALHECRHMHAKGIISTFVLSTLGKYGWAALPKFALDKRAKHLTDEEKAAVVSGLDAFIASHEGDYQADKDFAISVRNQYVPNTQEEKTGNSNRFFTKKIVAGAAMAGLVLAGVGYAFGMGGNSAK